MHVAWLMTMICFAGIFISLSREWPSCNCTNYVRIHTHYQYIYIYIYKYTYYTYIYIYTHIHRPRPSFASNYRRLSQHFIVFANVWTALRVRYMWLFQKKHCNRWIYVCLCSMTYVVLHHRSSQRTHVPAAEEPMDPSYNTTAEL